MNWSRILQTRKSAFRFCLLFVVFLSLQALVFELWQPLFGTVYMRPVSSVATFFLRLMRVQAELDTSQIQQGFCELSLDRIVYLITYDCVGIFALLIYLAATLAYPASVARKGRGLLLGIPAVFVFSALRVVILGLVAHLVPEWIELFHVYIMELATLGFVLFVWMYWINEVVYAD